MINMLGQFEQNKYHGHGTLHGTDGLVYTGSFTDGLKSGQGLLLEPDGTIYYGNFSMIYLMEQESERSFWGILLRFMGAGSQAGKWRDRFQVMAPVILVYLRMA